jgi:hypothetical protein
MYVAIDEIVNERAFLHLLCNGHLKTIFNGEQHFIKDNDLRAKQIALRFPR